MTRPAKRPAKRPAARPIDRAAHAICERVSSFDGRCACKASGGTAELRVMKR